MHTFKEGDRVKLSPKVKNHVCPEGREDNSSATIMSVYGHDNTCCHLFEDLHGCKYWNIDDLEPVVIADYGVKDKKCAVGKLLKMGKNK